MCDLYNWLSVSLMFSRFIHVVHASDLIPFYWWTVFHCMVMPQFILFIHQSMDIWVVSAFSFYGCKHSCKFLCECVVSFLLDVYLLGVELLAHMLILCVSTLATWCKELTIGKDPDAGKDRRREEKGTTEGEMVGWHHWLDGHEFDLTAGVGDRQGSLVCCGPWGHKESDTTEWLN